MKQNKKILILVSAFFLLLVVVTAWYLYTNLQNNKNYKEKTLGFQDITVSIRYKLEEGDDFFLDHPVIEDTKKIENFDDLFSQYGYLVPMPPKTFISAEPNGDVKAVNILKSEDFEKMKSGRLDVKGPDGSTSITLCELIGDSEGYTALNCHEEMYDTNEALLFDSAEIGKTDSCIVKVNNDYYLSFEQTVKTDSTDIGMCELIRNHDVSIIK